MHEYGVTPCDLHSDDCYSHRGTYFPFPVTTTLPFGANSNIAGHRDLSWDGTSYSMRISGTLGFSGLGRAARMRVNSLMLSGECSAVNINVSDIMFSTDPDEFSKTLDCGGGVTVLGAGPGPTTAVAPFAFGEITSIALPLFEFI